MTNRKGSGIVLSSLATASSAQGIGGNVFAPYFLTNDPILVSTAQASGIEFLTLAFVIAGNGCEATLNGTPLSQENSMAGAISDLRAIGGDVIMSFGGAAGQELAPTCGDAASLHAQYQSVIDKYQVKGLDFDIEGAAVGNTSANDIRNAALAGLQAANPGLVISYTLQVDPTAGLIPDAINLLQNAQVYGVNVSVVNIMTMDYYQNIADMGRAAVNASNAALGQLQSIGVKAGLGITPLIGINDSAPETFTIDNANTVLNFADSTPQVTRLSFWQVSRDVQCPSGGNPSSDTCSGVPQSPWQFSHIFEGFGGGAGNGGGTAPVGQIIWLKADSTNLFVSADQNLGSNAPLVADRTAVSTWEQFQWVDLGGGQINLQSVGTGLFVSADLNLGATAPLVADRSAASTWETFTWGAVGGTGTIPISGQTCLFLRRRCRLTRFRV
jgi:chitinase